MATRENPYGITVGANKQPQSAYPNGSTLIDTMVTYGFGNLRFQLHWDAMETTKGQRSYTQLDDMVGLANAAGLYFVFVFQKPPDFGSPPGPYMQLVNPHETTVKACTNHGNIVYLMAPTADTLKFVTELVTRYNGKTTKNPHDSSKYLYIDCYEIGNEEFDGAWNFDCAQPTSLWNGSTGQEGRDPHWFCSVAPEMANAIRAVNPSAKVGMHGSCWDFAPNRQLIIQKLYSTTYQGKPVADYLDYFNFHYYPGISPDQSASGQQSLLQEVADYTGQYPSGQTKRIQITEIGWNAPSDMSYQQAASYYKTAMDLMISSGIVEKFYAFTIAFNDLAEKKNLMDVTSRSPLTFTSTPVITQIQSYSQDSTIAKQWPKFLPPIGGGGSTSGGGGTGTPVLTLTVNTNPPGSVSLTQEGQSDTWAHYGTTQASDWDHKATPGQAGDSISAATHLGSGNIIQATGTTISYSWTDGASPHASQSGTATGIQVVASNSNGFSLKAPADTTERTLKVYVSVTQAGGILTASLSDGSAPQVTDSSLSSSTGTATACYTLVYQTSTASGASLTVSFVNNPNVTTSASTSGAAQEVTHQVAAQTAASQKPNIMVIAMENRAYSDVMGTDAGAWPNVNGWRTAYANLKPFYAVDHPSLPNYIAFVSGGQQGVNGDGPPGQFGPFNVPCLVELLDGAGVSWRAYAENLPAGGISAMSKDSGSYAVRHFPWVYFNGVRNSASRVAQLVPYTQSALTSDLNGTSPPQFVWLTPNINDDAHAGGLTSQTGDKFLGGLIPVIQGTAWYKSGGTIIIWFDESHPDLTNDAGIGDAKPGGGQTVCLVISEATKNMGDYTTPTNHYGVLRALCEAYGVTPPGLANHTVNGDITSILQGNGTSGSGAPPGPVPSTLSLVDTDTFASRSSSSSWGTASGGSVWTAEPSPASSSPKYSTGSDSGTIASSSSSGGYGVQVLGSHTSADAQGVVGLTVSAAGDSAQVLLRADSTGKNGYTFGLVAGKLTISLAQNGVLSTLNSQSGTTYNANQQYWLRCQAQGSALSARIWPNDGTSAEPTSWQVTTTDSTVQASSQFGLRGQVTNASDTVSFQQFSVYAIPVTTPAGSICLQSATLALTTTNTQRTLDLRGRINISGGAVKGTTTQDVRGRMKLQLPNIRTRDLAGRLIVKPPPPQRIRDVTARFNLSSVPITYAPPKDVRGRAVIASQPVPHDLMSRINIDALSNRGHDLSTRLLLAQILDTYVRADQAGSWGTATDGNAWTTSNGALTQAISSNAGTLTGSTTLSLLVLGSATAQRQTTPDLLVRFQVTASGDVVGLAARATLTSSSASYYGALLGNGALRLVLVSGGGAPATLASLSVASLTPNTWYWLRFQVSGAKLSARYWQEGSVAPTDWLLQANNTTLTASGYMGVLTQLAASGDTARIGYVAGTRVDPLPTPYDVLTRINMALDQDTFNRPARTGVWGTSAESGSIWAALSGNAPLSTTGVAGAIGTSPSTLTTMMLLGYHKELWSDVLVRFTVPSDTAGMSGVLIGCQNQQNTYSAFVVGGTILRTAVTVAGTQTVLGTTSVSLTPGGWYWMRVALVQASVGSTARVVKVRVWADGQTEPSPGWTLTSSADAKLVGFGGFGLLGWTKSATALLYTNFSARSQTFTNGRDISTRLSLADLSLLDIATRLSLMDVLPTGVLASDSFADRLVSTGVGFGTASDGEIWATTARRAMSLQVGSGKRGGWFFDRTAGTTGFFQAMLGTKTVTDVTVVARLTLGVLSPASASVYTELYTRSRGTTTATRFYYAARVSAASVNNISLVKMVAGSATVIPVATFPMPQDPTAQFWLKFQVSGTVLSIKTWLDTESEPLGWNWVGVDYDVTLAGQYGVGGQTSGTSTATESTIDSYSAETVVTVKHGIATRVSVSPPRVPGPRLLPLGAELLGQTRYGDGKYTPVRRARAGACGLSYTASPTRYALPLGLSYVAQRKNTAPLLLYYTLAPATRFAIDADSSIIRPDEVLYSPRPVSARTLLGGPIIQGYATMTWTYSVLRWAEFEQIIGHYDPEDPRVVLTYPDEQGIWVQREAVMSPPTYGTMVPGKTIEGVSFSFTALLF